MFSLLYHGHHHDIPSGSSSKNLTIFWPSLHRRKNKLHVNRVHYQTCEVDKTSEDEICYFIETLNFLKSVNSINLVPYFEGLLII